MPTSAALPLSQHEQASHSVLSLFNSTSLHPSHFFPPSQVPEGVYVGVVVESKNVKKARGRFAVCGTACLLAVQ